MSQPIPLGNFDLRSNPLKECGDCGSKNIVTSHEPDKAALSEFVKSRAGRLGLHLDDYNIVVNKTNGAVTAERKENVADLDIDFK
jgi:hypothetical protein